MCQESTLQLWQTNIEYSPPDSPLREAFLAESDDLPRELGLPKLQVLNRWSGESSHVIV